MTMKEFYKQYGVYGLPWWLHGEVAVSEGRCYSIKERDAVAEESCSDVPVYRFVQCLEADGIVHITIFECVGTAFLSDCRG